MLEAYREHVAERASQDIPPKPLSAEQVAALVELLKSPPAGEEEFLLELISTRIPPGVDEGAYVKAGFLSAIVRGETDCSLIDKPGYALADRKTSAVMLSLDLVGSAQLVGESFPFPELVELRLPVHNVVSFDPCVCRIVFVLISCRAILAQARAPGHHPRTRARSDPH